jgi:hypothetical protein
MITTLSSPESWAQNEFGFVQLGDQRRNKRLVQIAENLAANPGGTLPQALPAWAELKAAYRLFDQSDVTFQKILTPHFQRTRAACREPGEYLLIEDTSLLDYSHHVATQDLGVIGNGLGRGFELHSTLAVRVEQWTLEQRPEGGLVGLFDQQCRRPQPPPKKEKRGARLQRERKTQCWAAALKSTGAPPPQSQWIFIADREADFYEPMQTAQELGCDFIIRSYQDRRLADEAGTHLREALRKAPCQGQSTVEVTARSHQPARVATCEVRAVKVDLDGPWRPGGWQPPLKNITAIEIREVDAPAGAEPLHWVLLTSLPCTTWTEIRRVIGRYTGRWWIEEYHKALKSGTKVEESQLEKASRLEALIAILAVVAVRLLSTKMLARSQPDGRAAAESFGPEIIALLKKKFAAPKGGWTNENVLIAIARVGGFLARKGDGHPGWQTIWRGWHRLMWMVQGIESSKETAKCG